MSLKIFNSFPLFEKFSGLSVLVPNYAYRAPWRSGVVTLTAGERRYPWFKSQSRYINIVRVLQRMARVPVGLRVPRFFLRIPRSCTKFFSRSPAPFSRSYASGVHP